MRSPRSILALRYTPVSVAGGVRKAVGGFVRYVQYRDQHLEPDTSRAVDAYVRYVAHRDRTSPAGRVFSASDETVDRRRFVDFIARSTTGLEPSWVAGRDGKRVDRQRAVYTFVLSPEDWRGLDLRQLARVAMQQLESDAGPSGIGPWFAAEHRNTAHHHVHIVLAARREVASNRFSTLLVTRERLQRMKDAIGLEIERQRGCDRRSPDRELAERAPAAPAMHARSRATHHRLAWRPIRRARPIGQGRKHQPARASNPDVIRLRAIARRYQRRMEHELDQEQLHAEREGWLG